MNNSEIKTFLNLDELSRAAAAKFIELARTAIDLNNRFAVALGGGSTPKSLYKLLASEQEPFRSQVEWDKIYFFWGDERHVPPDHADSNFKMARETMLLPLETKQENVFRLKGELEAETAAADYAERLQYFFELPDNKVPRFDLILLGMGADGHTASLFPGTSVVQETEKTVAAPFVEKFNGHRLTLTPPVINNAANVLFLVGGADKAEALREVLEGERQPDKYPAQIVQPTNGNLLWFVDEAAAQLLTTAIPEPPQHSDSPA